METRKLYYEDTYLKEFTAKVVACEAAKGGFSVELDATAFYPEGGGQPCDLGTLGQAKVLDVQEQGETVIHLCDKALEIGATVEGRIDWDRRFDLMQQHTGEHIVSGIAHKLFGCHNVGFHMGTDVITVDLDTVIPAESLEEIELQANEAVWADLQVSCSYPTEKELAALPYRSKKELPWPVRIVQTPGYDTCACCGLHVATTGQIGLVKLLSCVKFHQGVRIEMVCGRRAWEMMSRVYEQNRQVSQAFSAKLHETGAAARRMNEALAAEKQRAADLEKQLFERIAEEFTDRGDVVYFANGLTPNGLRELTERIARRCGGTAAVFTGDETRGNVCIIGDKDTVNAMGTVIRQQLNGKGGGKPGFFQGSLQASKEEICHALSVE